MKKVDEINDFNECIQNRDMKFNVYRDIDISHLDISGQDLSCSSFLSCDMANVNMSRCNLNSCKFISCDISGSRVDLSSLNNSSFNSCFVSDVDFTESKMDHVIMNSVVIDSTTFKGVDLSTLRLDAVMGMNEWIKTCQFMDKFYFSYTKDRVHFGCESRTLDEWNNMSEKEFDILDEDAYSQWKKYKELVNLTVKTAPARSK